MSTDPGRGHDGRDVDAEFARMLEGEGLVLRPGEAPREPAAPVRRRPGAEGETWDADGDEPLWSPSADSPPEPPSPQAIARSRAAHPSARAHDPIAGLRGAAGPRDLDDDEVLYGDFEPPDPDLPVPSERALWSWTALLGGFAMLLIVAVTPTLPALLGWTGGLAALGGLVSLLLRAPREHPEDGDDGAEV